MFQLIEKKSAGYNVHTFEDEAHAKAYCIIQQVTLHKMSDARGGLKLLIDHRLESDNRVESLADTIRYGSPVAEEYHEMTKKRTRNRLAPGPFDPATLPPTAIAHVDDCGHLWRKYTVAGRTIWLSEGQEIGIQHAIATVPARVVKLLPDRVEVQIDNDSYHGAHRFIDMTRCGPGLTADKVILQPQPEH